MNGTDGSTIWKGSDEMRMDKTVTVFNLLSYLQMMLDDYNERVEKYGAEERYTKRALHDMIACKEMVEVLIDEPVNLRKDGAVTVGF